MAAMITEDCREEGEIIDSDFEYTPLERPSSFIADTLNSLNPSSIMNMKIVDDDHYSSDSDAESSSSSDSDGNCGGRSKKPKIKIRKHRLSESSRDKKPDKYKIWCKTVQEDTLTEDLIGCGVAMNKRYGIESYDHTILFRLNENRVPNDYNHAPRQIDDCDSDIFRNKRKHRDQKNVRLRLGRRSSTDSVQDKGETRFIPDLSVSVNSSEEDVAKDIADKLAEEKLSIILRTVENIGKQKAIDIFRETKRIEEDGGMMIMNGMRRRTPGGIFIFLLKRDDDVTREMLKEIFSEEKLENNRQKRRAIADQNHRSKKVEMLKQSLTDCALPTLQTRAEQWAAASLKSEDTNHVSNPPPSPVTDGRECSSDIDTNHFTPTSSTTTSTNRDFQTTKASLQDPRAASSRSYDEDFLDINADDMDLF